MMELGPVAIASVAIAAVVVLAIVALVLKALFSRGHKRRRGQRTGFHDTDGRIAVLETTDIDERRKLVLVRCDDVEHLIVIGGPSDLLVENDVRKTRPQSVAASRTPTPSPMQPAASPPLSPAATPRTPAAAARVPAAMGASLDAAIAAIVPKASSPEAPQARAGEPRPPLAARSTPTPAPARPGGRNGEALPAPLPRAMPAAERRDAPGARRSAQQSQLPARTDHPRQTAERPSRDRASEANGLPPAQVPWPETDSIEDEIVQALRFESPRGGDQPSARRDPPMSPPPKPVVESNATLGDLADRLEEALAREISSTAPPSRRAEPEPAAEPPKAAEPERGRRNPSRERPEKRESRSESRQAVAPEAQRETQQPERREEAPVISLNARRREAADPLEDEMARLLGELTGDTKGR